MNKKFSVLFLVVLLGACSSLFKKEEQGRLGDLRPAVGWDFGKKIKFIKLNKQGQAKSSKKEKALLSEQVSASKAETVPDLTQVISRYEQALSVATDPLVRAQIQHRLADLNFLKAEQTDLADLKETIDDPELAVAEASLEGEYTVPLEAYKALLKAYPSHPKRAQILYRMAQTADVEGDVALAEQSLEFLVKDHKQSPLVDEAWFRLGDKAFSQRRYQDAQVALNNVITITQKQNLKQFSYYLLGWSYFKQQQTDFALESFFKLFNLEQIKTLVEVQDNEQIHGLFDDSLRIVSIIFSERGGVTALNHYLQTYPADEFEQQLYIRLAEHYIEKERYLDAISSYKGFIVKHSKHFAAQVMQEKIIQTYQKAAFTKELLKAKEEFVIHYAPDTVYWQETTRANQKRARELTREYLSELSAYHHVLATRLEKKNTKQSQQYFRTAARWYRQYVGLFPTEITTGEKWYLLGECLYALQDLSNAIFAYDQAAYFEPTPKQATDAGYAAVVTYSRYISLLQKNKQMSEADKLKKRYDQIHHAIKFSDHFSAEKRSLKVRLAAAEQLLSLSEFGEATRQAELLIEKLNQMDVQNRTMFRSAWHIQAESFFEAEQYAQAEKAYEKTLLYEVDQKEQYELRERLAASVYRQGEQWVVAGGLNQAIAEFQRVRAVAPRASVVANADFDAATYLLQAERWQEGVAALQLFKQRYPKHTLVATIPVKLALAYEKTGQWSLAASSLLQISKQSSDSLVRKQALLKAAQLFEREQQYSKAIEAYRRYAHQYPDPLLEHVEIQYKLTELYLQIGDHKKRAFWLKKMIDTHEKYSSEQTERTLYLAAFARDVFAEQALYVFKQITLKAPLKRNLKRKQKAMKKAIAAYEASLAYGVASFATKASFRIADIYTNLSTELMNSERPKGLNELELEQYDLLLEEQAYPFEEESIAIHVVNIEKSWGGVYDDWVQKSFTALKELMPGRFDKPEKAEGYSEFIY